MAATGTFTWTGDWRGRARPMSRDVNYTLDTRALRGTPGYALLVVAANPHLSAAVLRRLLESQGVGRSETWIRRRLWLFRPPDSANSPGPKRNADGKDERALAIMADNRTLSLGQLTRLLSEYGIRRSREWVRRNRSSTVTPA